jgi:hypothetical protein
LLDDRNIALTRTFGGLFVFTASVVVNLLLFGADAKESWTGNGKVRLY